MPSPARDVLDTARARERGFGLARKVLMISILVMIAGVVLAAAGAMLIGQDAAIPGFILGGIGGLGLPIGFVWYIVAGIRLRAAAAKLPKGGGALDPIRPGERFGHMLVLATGGEDSTLHMALPAGALKSSIFRIVSCLAMIAFGVGFIMLAIMGTGTNSIRAGGFGILLCGAGVAIAAAPFAVQWIAGPLPIGVRGLTVERVRWFFKREAVDVPAGDIESIILTDVYLTVSIREIGKQPLVRVAQTSALQRWDLERVAAGLCQALGRPIPIERRQKNTF